MCIGLRGESRRKAFPVRWILVFQVKEERLPINVRPLCTLDTLIPAYSRHLQNFPTAEGPTKSIPVPGTFFLNLLFQTHYTNTSGRRMRPGSFVGSF